MAASGGALDEEAGYPWVELKNATWRSLGQQLVLAGHDLSLVALVPGHSDERITKQFYVDLSADVIRRRLSPVDKDQGYQLPFHAFNHLF